MRAALYGSLAVALTAFQALAVAQEEGETASVQIDRGELSVLFCDNSQSPGVLSGIDQLFNTKHAAGFDAYDPDTPGASAGLNFEHIISGHESENNKFTPRHGRYTLRRLPDGQSVELLRKADDGPWKVASTLRYTVRAPHYIDFTFRCTPEDAALFGPRQYAVFFFANYMNDVAESAIHFRGHAAEDAPETWIAADAPKSHPDWNGGGNYRAIFAADLKYDDDVTFRLNSWTYDWPRIASPFYYGRAARNMTLILMFDRLHTARDQIRFSLYKFKLPKYPRPAWDFQYVINRVETGMEYGFRGRLVWKKFVSAEDCFEEYERWSAGLETDQDRIRKQRIQNLKKLGATVFERSNVVIEVSANRTRIGDAELANVADFAHMTDLSLEETTVSDAGLMHLRRLQKLEWLNLYRTRVGNDGLKELSRLKSLQHLPVGGTLVTDAGLAHLRGMTHLAYLGLRDNDVSDAGLMNVRPLTGLTGLHLGGTHITDAGLVHLQGMTRLQKLWLDETLVSDQAVKVLGGLTSLRELHVSRTKMTPNGVKKLAALLPRCRILD